MAQEEAGSIFELHHVEVFTNWESSQSDSWLQPVLPYSLTSSHWTPEALTLPSSLLLSFCSKWDSVRGNHLTSLVLECGHHGRVACVVS